MFKITMWVPSFYGSTPLLTTATKIVNGALFASSLLECVCRQLLLVLRIRLSLCETTFCDEWEAPAIQ